MAAAATTNEIDIVILLPPRIHELTSETVITHRTLTMLREEDEQEDAGLMIADSSSDVEYDGRDGMDVMRGDGRGGALDDVQARLGGFAESQYVVEEVVECHGMIPARSADQVPAEQELDEDDDDHDDDDDGDDGDEYLQANESSESDYDDNDDDGDDDDDDEDEDHTRSGRGSARSPRKGRPRRTNDSDSDSDVGAGRRSRSRSSNNHDNNSSTSTRSSILRDELLNVRRSERRLASLSNVDSDSDSATTTTSTSTSTKSEAAAVLASELDREYELNEASMSAVERDRARAELRSSWPAFNAMLFLFSFQQVLEIAHMNLCPLVRCRPRSRTRFD